MDFVDVRVHTILFLLPIPFTEKLMLLNLNEIFVCLCACVSVRVDSSKEDTFHSNQVAGKKM